MAGYDPAYYRNLQRNPPWRVARPGRVGAIDAYLGGATPGRVGAAQDYTGQVAATDPYRTGADFNINPAPTTGQGWAGLIPGPIGLPNPAADLGAQIPGLSSANKAASDALIAKLGGQLSPGTLKQMQDYEAQFAARSGMPGSNAVPGTLGYNRGVRDLGLTAEGQVEQGLQDYSRLIPTVSSTQTVKPETQLDLAARNAAMAAAPDPFAQQSHAEMLYNEYLNRLRGPGGGTRTGTTPSPMPETPIGPSGTMPARSQSTPYGTPPEFIEYNAISGNYYDTRTGQILGTASGSDGAASDTGTSDSIRFPFDYTFGNQMAPYSPEFTESWIRQHGPSRELTASDPQMFGPDQMGYLPGENPFDFGGF